MAIAKPLRSEPVTLPPLRGVTLELTVKEAQLIRDLVGAVGGFNEAHDLYTELRKIPELLNRKDVFAIRNGG